MFAPCGGQAGSQWQLTVNDVSQRGQEQPLDVKKKPKEKETQGKFPALVFDIGFAGSLPALPGAADTRRGQGDRCGVTGQGPGGKPWRGGGELRTGPSRKETCLTVPLKAVIGISSSFGLSSGFSQLLSLCWAQGCGVQGAEIREMSISFLSDIDFPVR